MYGAFNSSPINGTSSEGPLFDTVNAVGFQTGQFGGSFVALQGPRLYFSTFPLGGSVNGSEFGSTAWSDAVNCYIAPPYLRPIVTSAAYSAQAHDLVLPPDFEFEASFRKIIGTSFTDLWITLDYGYDSETTYGVAEFKITDWDTVELTWTDQDDTETLTHQVVESFAAPGMSGVLSGSYTDGVLTLKINQQTLLTMPVPMAQVPDRLQVDGNGIEIDRVDIFESIVYPTPYATSVYRASPLGRVTAFGLPSTPVYSVVFATGVEDTTFGSGYIIPVFQLDPEDIVVAATGSKFFGAGTPSAVRDSVVQAEGTEFTRMGSPTSAVAGAAQPTTPLSSFGTPAGGRRERATGFLATSYGFSGLENTVRSVGKSHTRWGGRPWARALGEIKARGWAVSRFGRHSSQEVEHVTLHIGDEFMMFGQYAGQSRYKVWGAPRGTQFGTPIARRNKTC